MEGEEPTQGTREKVKPRRSRMDRRNEENGSPEPEAGSPEKVKELEEFEMATHQHNNPGDGAAVVF